MLLSELPTGHHEDSQQYSPARIWHYSWQVQALTFLFKPQGRLVDLTTHQML